MSKLITPKVLPIQLSKKAAAPAFSDNVVDPHAEFSDSFVNAGAEEKSDEDLPSSPGLPSMSESSTSTSTSSMMNFAVEIERLQAAKAAAVENEDYVLAAELKNQIERAKLEAQKQQAVEEESYERAAALKLEMEKLEQKEFDDSQRLVVLKGSTHSAQSENTTSSFDLRSPQQRGPRRNTKRNHENGMAVLDEDKPRDTTPMGRKDRERAKSPAGKRRDRAKSPLGRTASSSSQADRAKSPGRRKDRGKSPGRKDRERSESPGRKDRGKSPGRRDRERSPTSGRRKPKSSKSLMSSSASFKSTSSTEKPPKSPTKSVTSSSSQEDEDAKLEKKMAKAARKKKSNMSSDNSWGGLSHSNSDSDAASYIPKQLTDALDDSQRSKGSASKEARGRRTSSRGRAGPRSSSRAGKTRTRDKKRSSGEDKISDDASVMQAIDRGASRGSTEENSVRMDRICLEGEKEPQERERHRSRSRGRRSDSVGRSKRSESSGRAKRSSSSGRSKRSEPTTRRRPKKSAESGENDS